MTTLRDERQRIRMIGREENKFYSNIKTLPVMSYFSFTLRDETHREHTSYE